MIGSTSIELEFTFTFSRDGSGQEVDRIAIARRGSTDYDLVKWGDDERLFNLLPEAIREQLLSEAWSNAEDDDSDGDAKCDEARAEVAG